MYHRRSRPGRSSQAGFTLTEALLSVVVGAVATLGLVQVNASAIGGAASAKLHSEALGLAEQKVEQLRNLRSLAAYEALASSDAAESLAGAGATYARSWTVTKAAGSGDPAHARVAVTVTWQDSDGVAHSVVSESILAEVRPEKSGQWYRSPQADPGYQAGEAQDELEQTEPAEPAQPPATETEGSGGEDASPESDTTPSTEEPKDEVVSSCTSKQIEGTVTRSNGAKANMVVVRPSKGRCDPVSGTPSEADFSCTVACEGTVTLFVGTDEQSASASPATINLILGEHASPIQVAVNASKNNGKGK
jgi:Tfp pilus assembly protein PilV